jgi:hypothetical protein
VGGLGTVLEAGGNWLGLAAFLALAAAVHGDAHREKADRVASAVLESFQGGAL